MVIRLSLAPIVQIVLFVGRAMTISGQLQNAESLKEAGLRFLLCANLSTTAVLKNKRSGLILIILTRNHLLSSTLFGG